MIGGGEGEREEEEVVRFENQPTMSGMYLQYSLISHTTKKSPFHLVKMPPSLNHPSFLSTHPLTEHLFEQGPLQYKHVHLNNNCIQT